MAAIAACLVAQVRSPGPFFHFNSGHPLSWEMFVKHVRGALSSQGVDVSSYSGPRFHIGAAMATAATGLVDSLMKTLGRWQSAAYQFYVLILRECLVTVSMQLSKV